MHPENTYPIADVDDTEGFMAAARAYRQKLQAMTSTVSDDAVVSENANDDASHAGSEVVTSKVSDDGAFGETAKEGVSLIESEIHQVEEVTEKFVVDEVTVPADTSDNVAVVANDETNLTPVVSSPSATPSHVETPSPVMTTQLPTHPSVEQSDEDREHLTTFKTWGIPAARDKPAARVRRIIIKGLPIAWRIPTKVLSLIHGGAIESINISSTGNAHVLFCEPEACQAFYDKYPNGIDIDKNKGQTVFVEMGTDVDVISSQLVWNLSVGATRVVRAVGADMVVTMGQLLKLAAMNNRKVEKILDSYVPGDARNVVFRFCSIADAITFRGMILREHDWEHCNIQYAKDPCEIATDVHFD